VIAYDPLDAGRLRIAKGCEPQPTGCDVGIPSIAENVLRRVESFAYCSTTGDRTGSLH